MNLRTDFLEQESHSDAAAAIWEQTLEGEGSDRTVAEESNQRVLDALSRFRNPIPQEDLIAECTLATAILEEQPAGGRADLRIELAWRVVNALLYDTGQVETCSRALLAAFPAKTPVQDRVWERRWLTAIAVTERIRGNIAQSLRAEAAGLSLAQEIGDLQGQASSLANLAAHAQLAARFDESLQLSELAIQAAMQSLSLDALANAYVVRGNTRLYLGRYEDSLRDAHEALLAVGPVSSNPDKRRIVLAKALAAESLVSLGKLRDAGVAVESAEKWAGEAGGWALMHEARRVRALLNVANGDVRRGLQELKELRTELGINAPSLLVDLLQSEYRARTMAGDHEGAVSILQELRSYFVSQAEQTIRGLQETPTLARYLQVEPRSADIEQYFESKKLLNRVVCPVNNSWEYLVSLAASSVSPEDPTLEHGLRVGRLAALVARALALGAEMEAAVLTAGLVHDVGKVGVPPDVLLTSERLSEAELAIYRSHAETGAQLLEQADFRDRSVAINVARYHHTAFDGLGGRFSPRGEEIPLEARIVAVCDAFDSLLTGRPRQAAVSIAAALEDIYRRSGRDFDPRVVDGFVDAVRRLPGRTSDLVEELSAGAKDIPYFASRRALRHAARIAADESNVLAAENPPRAG